MSTRSTVRPDSARRGSGSGQAPNSPRGPAIGMVAAIVVAVLAVGIALFIFRDRGTTDNPGEGGSPATMSHVPGVGIDPADGQLYAGTHHGLFRVPEDGSARRIAGRVQDFMGFTVVGAGHYLPSGHPGPGQNGPASLGLIETTDGGRSWRTVSLAGEADFHALEAKHGQVYGYSGGQLMVSADGGKSWEIRGQIAIADLAVSPSDASTIIATTQEGPARSSDSGHSFRLLTGAPQLLLVTWPAANTIVGVAPDGAVHVSEDGGSTWQRRGTAGGAPQALTATDSSDIYVATEEGVAVSADGWRSFTTRYRAS